MNGWWWAAIGPLAWFALIVLAARAGAWSARRRSEGDRLAQAQEHPARQVVEDTAPAAPGTRQPRIHPRHGRHLLTARLYTGGTVIWDAQGRKIAEFCDPVPGDGEWDEWAARLWEQK